MTHFLFMFSWNDWSIQLGFSDQDDVNLSNSLVTSGPAGHTTGEFDFQHAVAC